MPYLPKESYANNGRCRCKAFIINKRHWLTSGVIEQYKLLNTLRKDDICLAFRYTVRLQNGEVAEWSKAHAWKVCIR